MSEVVAPPGRRVVKLPWIIENKSMSKASIYRAMEHEGFPSAIKLTGRSVGWFFDEVEAWFENRPRGVAPCADNDQYQTESYLTSRPGS
jgi:predicted DNA-binding transcriptional regulator AlpA